MVSPSPIRQLKVGLNQSEAGIIKNNLTNPDAFSDALALYYSIYQQEHSKFVKENPEITAMLAKLSASKKISQS